MQHETAECGTLFSFHDQTYKVAEIRERINYVIYERTW